MKTAGIDPFFLLFKLSELAQATPILTFASK
jgi:hypothetical protein